MSASSGGPGQRVVDPEHANRTSVGFELAPRLQQRLG
jgi:hypothetical protein